MHYCGCRPPGFTGNSGEWKYDSGKSKVRRQYSYRLSPETCTLLSTVPDVLNASSGGPYACVCVCRSLSLCSRDHRLLRAQRSGRGDGPPWQQAAAANCTARPPSDPGSGHMCQRRTQQQNKLCHCQPAAAAGCRLSCPPAISALV